MKKLIFIALVLFVTTVNGQNYRKYTNITMKGFHYNIEDSIILQCKLKNDTLIIYDFNKIKFIKIGDRVYKIESPTLTEITSNKSSFLDIISLKNYSPFLYNNK